MADQQKVVYGISNGAMFNNCEQPLTQFSRSRNSLTLNISQTTKDTAVVAIKCEQETVPKLSNGAIFNDLE